MVSIEELRAFDIFSGLTDSELDSVRELAKKVEFEEDKRIFEEKSQATDLYLVLKGHVEIRMRADKGRSQMPIDTIGQGDIFGWSSVTEPHTLTAAAWTLEKSELLVLKGEDLRDLFKKNNHIGYLIMMEVASVISSRLRNLNQKCVNNL
ncbi:MAG: cyclic nucleotide-binding domain-containing protein [Candidatus Aminicenantes bacterium]|jgi:CRP-like cAMP-binding protein